jgi:hypothetical protein
MGCNQRTSRRRATQCSDAMGRAQRETTPGRRRPRGPPVLADTRSPGPPARSRPSPQYRAGPRHRALDPTSRPSSKPRPRRQTTRTPTERRQRESTALAQERASPPHSNHRSRPLERRSRRHRSLLRPFRAGRGPSVPRVELADLPQHGRSDEKAALAPISSGRSPKLCLPRESGRRRPPNRRRRDARCGRDATARRLLPLAAASPGIAITSESRTSLSHLVQRSALDRRSQSCGFGYTQKRRPSRPLSVEAEARWVSDQTTAPERIEP